MLYPSLLFIPNLFTGVPSVTPAQREADQRAASVLLDSLGERLVAVLPDCSNDQLSRALWAYGASRLGRAEEWGRRQSDASAGRCTCRCTLHRNQPAVHVQHMPRETLSHTVLDPVTGAPPPGCWRRPARCCPRACPLWAWGGQPPRHGRWRRQQGRRRAQHLCCQRCRCARADLG